MSSAVERARLIHGDFFIGALAKCLARRRHRRTPANGSGPAVVGMCDCKTRERSGPTLLPVKYFLNLCQSQSIYIKVKQIR